MKDLQRVATARVTLKAKKSLIETFGKRIIYMRKVGLIWK
jgi:hypothetical protein